jgi:hypothetical protein
VAAALRLLVVAAMLAPAVAGAGPADELAAAEVLFDEQEYGAVIATLRPVVAGNQATRAQRLRALELTALSQLILGDEAAARATFERLLDIDPGYPLRDHSGSPRIRRFFDDVRRDVVPDFDADHTAELDHAAPPEATAGRRLEIDVRATAGGDRVKEVVAWVRRRGDQDYRDVAGAFRGDARWRVRLTPEASREPYTLEYYLEGRGLTGQVVARVGGPDAPLTVAITAGASATAKKWYARWYVWAGVGAAAVGAGALIVGASGADDGTLPPGRITVTP